MKKTLLFFAFYICLMIGSAIFTSCSKDDTPAPVTDWASYCVGEYTGTVKTSDGLDEPISFTISKVSDRRILYTDGSVQIYYDISDMSLTNTGNPNQFFFNCSVQTDPDGLTFYGSQITDQGRTYCGVYSVGYKNIVLRLYVETGTSKTLFVFNGNK